MTVMAAKIKGNTITMSCDSQVSRGDHSRTEGYMEKIIEGPDFLAGISGVASMLTIMTMYAKNHPVGEGGIERITEWMFEFQEFHEKRTKSWGQNGHVLLAHRSGLFSIFNSVPVQVDDFYGAGSGYQHAETAMYLGKSTKEAVGVAIQMADGCGGKIVTRKIRMN